VVGNVGTKGAQISITSYTSGDAKWYFQNIPVTGGATYQFSDYSLSDVATIIVLQYAMKDGTVSYADIANVPASASYKLTTVQFTAPANAASVEIFHVINQVGSLSVLYRPAGKVRAGAQIRPRLRILLLGPTALAQPAYRYQDIQAATQNGILLPSVFPLESIHTATSTLQIFRAR
jgi:hypothetical protein